MNETRARDLFLEAQRRPLAPADALALGQFLATRPDLAPEFAQAAATLQQLDALPTPRPSPRLRQGVLAAIEREKRTLRAARAAAAAPRAPRAAGWRPLLQAAAAAGLLLLGFCLGQRSGPERAGQANAALADKVAGLEKQVNSMGTLVGYTLLQQQQSPTNDRLRRVLASAAVTQPDDRVINDLIGSLALDPSTIVRLNALEALYPHSQQDVVRAGVLASLPREQNPIVQVAMIDFLVAAHDREAAPALEKLSASSGEDRGVREAARRALPQL